MMIDQMSFDMIFIGCMVLAVLLFVVVFISAGLTNAFTQFKAKIKKEPLIYAYRGDRKVDVHIGKYMGIEGVVFSPKHNAYYPINPDGVYQDRKTGITHIPVNIEVGIIATPEVLHCMSALKDAGIENIDDAENWNALWGVCEKCGFMGICNPDIKPDGKYELFCPKGCVNEIKEEVVNVEKHDTERGNAVENKTENA